MTPPSQRVDGSSAGASEARVVAGASPPARRVLRAHAAMRWNVTIIDPPTFPYTHFLFDVVRTLAFTLEELGHECSITQNRLEPGRMNLLVGVHLIDDPGTVEAILDGGAPYVVLQTEMVHGRSINREAGDRMDRIVLPLLRGASGVWDSSPENIAALRGLGVEAGLLRFGYQAKMRELALAGQRDVDFFWYGSITDHRRAVLAELSRLGYRVEVCFDQASLYRNSLLERSEVVLTLQQSAAMPHVPHMRLFYLVTNGCLVAGEGGENQAPVEDLFLWSDPRLGTATTVEHLRVARARRDRRELARVFQERLARRPMRDHVAPLLERLAETKRAA